jgi:hypothetical protein
LAKISVGHEQRVDDDILRVERCYRIAYGRDTTNEPCLDLQVADESRNLLSKTKDAFVAASIDVAAAMCSNQSAEPVLEGVQWLVPSEKVILFHTLYFPDGRDIGIRFIS